MIAIYLMAILTVIAPILIVADAIVTARNENLRRRVAIQRANLARGHRYAY